MAFYVKAFVFVLFVYFASALPLEGQPEDVQLDLFAIDGVPEQNVQAFDSNDDLTRAKRNYYGE